MNMDIDNTFNKQIIILSNKSEMILAFNHKLRLVIKFARDHVTAGTRGYDIITPNDSISLLAIKDYS